MLKSLNLVENLLLGSKIFCYINILYIMAKHTTFTVILNVILKYVMLYSNIYLIFQKKISTIEVLEQIEKVFTYFQFLV